MTDITQNITAPDRYLLRTTRRIGMLSYKSAKVRFDHRTTVQGISFPSIFTLIDTELTKTFTQFYLSDGNQSLSIAGRVVAEFPDTITTGSPPWAEVLISIQAVGRYWNRESGEWEVDFYANRFPMTDTEGAVGEETDIKFEANINVETGLIPDLPGDEIEIIFYIARSTNTDPVVISNYTDFKNFELTLNNPAVEEGQNTAIDYMLTQQSAARGRYDDGSIWFSDGPTAYARSAITRDADGQELTSAWRFSDETASIVHANILLREVMDMKRTQVRGLTSDLLGEYKPCKLPNIDDFFHFFIGGNQNGKDNKWAANLFRLNRKKDDLMSTGELLCTNHSIGFGERVYTYLIKDGVLINAQAMKETVYDISPAAYGLEYDQIDGMNRIVCVGGNSRFAQFDINEARDGFTHVQTVNLGISGMDNFDIDEEGSIYPNPSSVVRQMSKFNRMGILQWEFDAGNNTISGARQVDSEHVYFSYNPTTGENYKIFKLNRQTGDPVLSVTTSWMLGDTREDTMLIYPETIVYLNRESQSIRVLSKSDLSVIKTVDIGAESFDARRMVYDDSGIIYVLSQNGFSKWDSSMNFIASYTFTQEDFGLSVPPNMDEIAVGVGNYDDVYLRNGADIFVISKDGQVLNSYIGIITPRSTVQNRGRFMNIHPGRAAIKFRILGIV